MATAIVRRSTVPIETRALAREAGVHPDLVRRFVALGLLEPYPVDAAARIARAARLRAAGPDRRTATAAEPLRVEVIAWTPTV